MTQEEKQLLLRDLCARLPYGVRINHIIYGWEGDAINFNRELESFAIEKDNGLRYDVPVEEVRPYLRPMSSMTEEEDTRRCAFLDDIEGGIEDAIPNYIDWLNSHHFDYRGLIEKGLALEAPAGMYNNGESEKRSDIPVPKTVDEAVSTLEKILSDEDREYLLENGAISMHDSLGRWIRNEWGLWTGSELKDELMNLNKGLNHPDDMSNYIIEEFIKYWNNKS